ncbi:MAG: hypothetical protein KGI94_16760, partial [Paracoccaceae bacterium]|nr:hypothetical protein [Paracoccaceae bacterium]
AGERYLVRVSTETGIVREATVGVPSWTYGAAQRAADGVTGAFTLSVAQISDRFGAGPFTEMGING